MERIHPRITVYKSEYDALIENNIFLSCLFAVGVENWGEYDKALDMCDVKLREKARVEVVSNG